MKKEQSTEQRLKTFLRVSPLGAAFVLSAMEKYAKDITTNEQDVLDSFKDSFISGPAWVSLARQWLAN